jgi:competence protein ComFC
VCGDPLPQPGICPTCSAFPPAYTALRSWCVYQGVAREAVHQLKYRRDIGLADALAVPLCELLASLDWSLDAIVPVPLSLSRRRQRGYNQSSFLARPLALAFGLPFRPALLVRIRETNPQVGLSAQGRRDNVAAAFQAAPTHGLRVLVVDDVITTGSTMNACAQALIAAGAAQVFGISFARAVLPDQLVPSDPIFDPGGTNDTQG